VVQADPKYRLSVRLDVRSFATSNHENVLHFLVEIRMNSAGQLELERAARTLETAQNRLWGTATPAPRMVYAGFIRDDGRLVCLIEATGFEVVQRLVRMALLPAGRIHELTHLTSSPTAQGRSAR
jgi:hypothetical protein